MPKRKIPSELRSWVFARDNGRCRACGFADPDHLEADHIVPESLGGEATLENLATLCGACNRVKGDAIVADLPILPPIVGFGDFATVMQNREQFKATVSRCRQRMVSDAVSLVRTWHKENVPASIIRQRIPSLVGNRNVQKVIFEAFRHDTTALQSMAQ